MNVRLSISRKNKETGVYEDEFSGFCMFIGEARAKAERLKERDRIRLGDVDVTRRYDKETKREYYTFKVFSFEMADQAGQGSGSGSGSYGGGQYSARTSGNPVDSNPVEDDGLPF